MSDRNDSLALDWGSNSLEHWIILGQLFPSDGIIGVKERPTEDDVAERVLLELGVDSSEVELSTIADVNGKARKWFLPGDVICRFIGIADAYCDVVRCVQDIYYIGPRAKGGFDSKDIERERRNALEQHRWCIHRERKNVRCGQLVIVDPFGRALVVSQERITKRWRRVVERAMVVRRNKPNAQWETAAWLAIRVLHRRAYELFESVGEIDLDELGSVAEYVYETRGNLRHHVSIHHRTVKLYPCHDRSPTHNKWWLRVEELWSRGEELPYPLRMKMEHPALRWVMCSVSDLEKVLEYASWVQWKEKYPSLRIKEERPGTTTWAWR